MSMRTDVYYGYGWNGKVLGKIKNEKLFELFEKHMPEEFRDFIGSFTEAEIEESEDYDILDEYIGENGGRESRYNIIADIISKGSGIRVNYVEEPETGDCAVILLEGCPWQFSEKELNLTQETLEKIFAKYAIEFGIPGEEAGGCRVEVWG